MTDELLKTLSEDERKAVLNILKEYSDTGSSQSYKELLNKDYNEIPVSIDEFLHNPKYLGKGLIDKEGRFTLFPYWENLLKEIFPDPLKPAACNTLALTGAIGLGKSTVAVIIGCYELYRMMCLKDPYLYYGLQPIDLITFSVINITLDAAKGVAWDKIQNLIQSSEWFMKRGKISKSDPPEWRPPDGIELIYGSQSRHIIGRAVYWCLDGDTEILTSHGDRKISELVDQKIQVYNINSANDILLSDVCTVKPTAKETIEYEIELEDNSIIKCTPSHRFMLKDGSYKEAQFLTPEDDILEFIPAGYVYKITNNITKDIYIGKRQSSTFDDKYWGSGKIQKRALSKYGQENFTREILAWARTEEELCELEEKYIAEYFELDECINLKKEAVGGATTSNTRKITNGTSEKHIGIDDDIPAGWELGSKNKGTTKSESAKLHMKESWTLERRKAWSERCKGENNSQWGNSEAHTGSKNGRFGKSLSQETKLKISNANSGRKYSSEVNKKKGRPGLKKPEGFGDKVSKRLSHTHWYNNGVEQHRYLESDVPEGWVRGKLK